MAVTIWKIDSMMSQFDEPSREHNPRINRLLDFFFVYNILVKSLKIRWRLDRLFMFFVQKYIISFLLDLPLYMGSETLINEKIIVK